MMPRTGTPLDSALDKQQPPYSADELPRVLSRPQPDDDLWYVAEMGADTTVDWLYKLDDSDLRQMLRDLHAALKDVTTTQDFPTPSPISAPLGLPRMPPPQQRAHAEAVPLPEPKIAIAPIAETIVPTIPLSLTSPEPGPVADLELTEQVPTRAAAIRRAHLRHAPIGLALSTAIIAMVIPGSTLTRPVQPTNTPMSHASVQRAGLEPRLIGNHETPIQPPSTTSPAIPANPVSSAPPSSPAPETSLPTALRLPVQPTNTPISHASVQRAGLEPRLIGNDETPIQPPSTTSLAIPANPVPSASPSSAAPQNSLPTAARLDPKEIEALIQNGDRYLMARDVVAARSYYERAAAAGSGPAAFSLARTFDPEFLAQIGVRTVRPDPERAASWYRRANEAAAR